jgi:hypothetical protein
MIRKRNFQQEKAVQEENNARYEKSDDEFTSQPSIWREGLAIILLGFSSTALFMLVQVG